MIPTVRSAGVVIVNFLSHREESGLQWTIIFFALHDANRCLTLMFTSGKLHLGQTTEDEFGNFYG